MKKIIEPKPRFLKTKPFYLVKIPWVVTDGNPGCPHAYNNGLHAAVHSLIGAMRCDGIEDVRYWLRTGRKQLADAIRCLDKPGAAVVPHRRRSCGLVARKEGET